MKITNVCGVLLDVLTAKEKEYQKGNTARELLKPLLQDDVAWWYKSNYTYTMFWHNAKVLEAPILL